MELVLLAAILLLSLFIIPLGLPGTWVMLAAGVGYSILVPNSIGMIALVGTTVVAVVAEVIEFTLAGKYARKYGGSKRSGWGAIIGGTVGAIIGVPVPIVGPIIGAFAGAFVGAMVFEYTKEANHATAVRVAWGALVGRAIAAALKVFAGIIIAAWLMVAAL
jgi:uncharacterized protein YqgC (DUF456 family)